MSVSILKPPGTEDPCDIEVSWYVNDELKIGPLSYNRVQDIAPFSEVFETEGKYTIRLVVCNCCGCCEYSEVICVGPKVSIDRLGCLQFKLTDNQVYPDGLNLDLTIYAPDQTVIEKRTIENYTGEQSIDISYGYDGIYIVEYLVYNSANPANVIERKRFVTYDFCSILRCYKELLFGINCTTCDPCSMTKEEDKMWLDQLNMFVANVYAFIQYAAIHYGLENNHFLFREEYISHIDNTQKIVENLLRICGKCGFISHENPVPYKCVTIKPCGCRGKL
jgi:hypothetical protein